jgi:hypothetical protein
MAGSSINAFVKSIRGYVTANVKNANGDANPYLTKTEAKALPKDLKDNYETHRVLGNGNSTVVADKFIQKFTDYVAVQARKADANNDGYLTATEARKLPKDVRDNFANFITWR